MTAFRTAQPLAWTFHRGTVRRRSDNPQVLQPRPEPGREDPSAPWIRLPPGLRVAAPLADLVRGRVSCRVFRDELIGFAELATLLRAGYGVTATLDRAVPSGGGLYPLEVSLLVRSVDGVPAGIYHYVPLADGLERVRDEAVPVRLIRSLFLGQPWAAEAAVVLVFSAVCARSLGKYGERGYRYLLLEAGHAAQNVVLTATGLGLGSVNLGGFFDDELSGLLGLDAESEIVLYATAIGHPTPGDRTARRGLDRLTDG
ncbi:SagB/ThcOx family dehydrogenase [Kribbella capetownensis]|uniref:SagB/ThcOx family dehydrogenase n=1 Tax=Kribbella capetownensis TaxID=1572659 RepID=A0A4R0JLX8_9ACTN|nr:SagB/ThcOx family dehydrogenase [Kribbella capetownensis]TCC42905.1 SagB/ThcOx family dehydrogenase [Kribbella capetownensis]